MFGLSSKWSARTEAILKLATKLNCKSLSIPALGTGTPCVCVVVQPLVFLVFLGELEQQRFVSVNVLSFRLFIEGQDCCVCV